MKQVRNVFVSHVTVWQAIQSSWCSTRCQGPGPFYLVAVAHVAFKLWKSWSEMAADPSARSTFWAAGRETGERGHALCSEKTLQKLHRPLLLGPIIFIYIFYYFKVPLPELNYNATSSSKRCWKNSFFQAVLCPAKMKEEWGKWLLRRCCKWYYPVLAKVWGRRPFC